MASPRIGIIVQARTGSSRLPNKVVLPFYQGASILDILLERLAGAGLPMVVATTTHAQDDPVATAGHQQGAMVYRGAEHDVLRRFVDAAQAHRFTHVVRVCADNPMLSLDYLAQLVAACQADPDNDYYSFWHQGLPTIRHHFGLFAEIVSMSALNTAHKKARAPVYREHVTNFIYGHPGAFRLAQLALPEVFGQYGYLRLTVDTAEDFKNIAYLYQHVAKNTNFDLPEIVAFIDKEAPSLKSAMQDEINKNTK